MPTDPLLGQGYDVLSIDNFDDFYDIRFKQRNFTSLARHPKFKNFDVDLNNSERVEEILKTHMPDIIVHAAARAGVRPSLVDPLAYVRSNIQATTSLMEAMKKTGIHKIVFCSSSSVYGSRKSFPFEESMAFDSAISFYATSKQCGEMISRLYHNLYNFSVVNLRLFTVYGPRQRPDLAIHKFFKAALLGETVTMYGDGSMARDYTYIDDIVSGIVASIHYLSQLPNSIYKTYNLGGSHPVQLNELIANIEVISGKQMNLQRVGVPMGDVPITYADISAAQRDLGYHPRTPLIRGLSNFYHWLVSEKIYTDEKGISLGYNEQPNVIHLSSNTH